MLLGNKNRRFYIGGYNITKYVVEVSGLQSEQAKPEWGNLPEVPHLEFIVFNNKGEFSTMAPGGFFYGSRVTDNTVKVTRIQGSLETVEWSGFVENVLENFQQGKATIFGVSPLSKVLDAPALLSLGEATPAAISKAVFELFNVPVNQASYNAADAFLTNLIRVRLDPNLVNGYATLMELQRKLATAGVARIYPINGEMYYEVIQSISTSISFDISERNLFSHPEISVRENKETNYLVNYIDGNVTSAGSVTGSNNTTHDFGPNADVKIMALTGAQYVADGWKEISKRQSRLIKCGINPKLGRMMTLDTDFTLSWKKAAMNKTPLDVVGIDYSDPRYVVVTAETL